MMGAVLLTGATGFVGREILSRFLERGDREVYALVRAADDEAAAERLPAHARLTAVAGDIERSGLGLSEDTAERLRHEVTTVVHCAASVSFDLPLEESRRVNVEGTRNMVELRAQLRGARAVHATCPPPTWPASRAASSARTSSPSGQSFRNPYERSKFEAELALRSEGADLPLQILRPSIVVGDSTTGRTTSFNVLYGPLKAFARGAIRAIPARRDSPVDIVPVDYVADRVHELATDGPNGTFHLVAGRNATTVGRLLEMSAEELGRTQPTVLPPRLYRRWVHPFCAAGNPRAAADGGLLPLLRDARALRRPPPRPGPAGRALLPPAGPLRERAGWGRGRPSPTLVRVIEKLVEQIEGRFAELSEQMSDPEVISDQRRYAEVGRAYRALEPAHQLAQEWRRATDDAAGARELLAEDGDDPELREMLRSLRGRGSPSSRRRSGSRWSSPTRTTTRT